MELSPLYRTFQVYKFGNRKYNFLLNYFVVLNVWHGFVFCKIPISIPLNIETSIPRYFARRYSVRCWYRVPVYSHTWETDNQLDVPLGKYVFITPKKLKLKRFHRNLYYTAPLRGSDKNHKFTTGSGDGTITALSYLPSLQVRQP